MNKVMTVARMNPNIKIFSIIFYLLELIFTFQRSNPGRHKIKDS